MHRIFFILPTDSMPFCSYFQSLYSRNPSESLADSLDERIAILGLVAEFLLDAEKLVVFGHTVGAACGTGLDLAGVGSHSDIGDS